MGDLTGGDGFFVLRRSGREGSHRALAHVEPESRFRREAVGQVQAAEHIPEDPAVGVAIVLVTPGVSQRSEEHTSELQSQSNLVCRLLLEKNKASIAST